MAEDRSSTAHRVVMNLPGTIAGTPIGGVVVERVFVLIINPAAAWESDDHVGAQPSRIAASMAAIERSLTIRPFR